MRYFSVPQIKWACGWVPKVIFGSRCPFKALKLVILSRASLKRTQQTSERFLSFDPDVLTSRTKTKTNTWEKGGLPMWVRLLLRDAWFYKDTFVARHFGPPNVQPNRNRTRE